MINKLFFSSNRKNQNNDNSNNKQPDWMRIMVIVFIIYAGAKVYLQKDDVTTAGQDGKISHREARQLKQEEQIKQQLDIIKQQTQLAQQAQGITNPIGVPSATVATQSKVTLPSYVQISGEIDGQGDGAECGQQATVKVDALLPDGTTLEGYDAAAPARLTSVGNASLPWAAGLRGMKLGGVRQLTIPASYVTDETLRTTKNIDANSPIKFKLQLEKLAPTVPTNSIGFQAIDLQKGTGQPVTCGQKVKAQVHVWMQDGTPATTKPYELNIAVGSVPYFYGLDRGLVDMKVGGKRRLIVPPTYLDGLGDISKPNPADIAEKPLKEVIAGGHTVMLDVSLISVEKATQ